MELTIEKFTPKKAELTSLAQEAKSIQLPDPFDTEQLSKVQDTNKRLVKARNDVKKAGLEMRDEANKFRTQVLDIEKEYLAIIEPEEKRIKSLLDVADKAIERKARTELLPARKAKLSAIGDGLEVTDDELLDMDAPMFEGYCNMRLANKNEADRQAIALAQKKLDDEKAEIQRKKELEEAKERGRQEAKEKLEKEQREKEIKAQQEKEIPKEVVESDAKPIEKKQDEISVESLYAFRALVEKEYVTYVESLEDGEKASGFGFEQWLLSVLNEKITIAEIPF